METALRIMLGALLLGACGAKLRDRPALVARLADHRIPGPARAPVAAALLLAEGGLGVLLLAGVAPHAVAIAAMVLFVGFAAAFLRLRLAGAARAPCGCFGGRAERSTVALALRAAGLAGVAAYLAAGAPTPSGIGGFEALWIVVIALAGVVFALLVLVLALYRQVGVLSLRLGPRVALELEDEGPPLGTPAPALRGLARRGPELVSFASASCRLCAELAPGLRALAREGTPLHELQEHADSDAFARWKVPGTPYVVYVEDGIVAAKGLVNTLEQVDGLMATGVARRRAA